MKKFFISFLCLIFFLLPLSACKKNNNNNGGIITIRVNEVTDSIFYAPFYVAIDNGFFEEEGIKIELTNGAGSDVSMTALLSKSADIALLGPETCVYIARVGKKDMPKVFAQLTKRDGCFLISRTKEPDFNWNNLQGKTVITGRQGGLPAMTFEYVVKNLGLSGKVNLKTDLSFGVMAPTFDSGVGDYVTLFEPTASEFVLQGKGHIVASVGKKSGEVPYTTFCALSSYIEDNKDVVTKFTRAMMKAIKYTKTANSLEVSKVLKKHFTTTSLEIIEASLINYIENDSWKDDMILTENSYNSLIQIINNAGETTDGVTYPKIVDNSIATSVFSSLS